MFVEAGKGLAAAHELGVLHRDFKPANVLVGDDGRVRVADFGLAWIDRPDVLSPRELVARDGEPPNPVETPRGTPAYMAPEQHLDAANLDARADQYAFCVALWQGLTSGLPFATKQLSQPSRCSGAEQQIAGVWDADARATARRAMLATTVPYAEHAWDQVGVRLDDYAGAWMVMHQDACAATTVRREQPEAIMDLRMNCLRRAKLELEATTQQLRAADAKVVEHAHNLVASLPDLSRCADVESLHAEIPPPEEGRTAEVVKAVRERLAKVKVLNEVAKHDEAMALLNAQIREAGNVEYGPLAFELAFARGDTLSDLGHYPSAVASFQQALALAMQWGLWAGASQCLRGLMNTVGDDMGRLTEGFAYADLARAIIELGRLSPLEYARWRSVRANLLEEQKRYAEAEAEFRAVLEERLTVLGPERLEVAEMRHELGVILRRQDRLEEAEVELRQAIAIKTKVLGPEHPMVAISQDGLAVLLGKLGRLEEAEALHRAELATWQRAMGPDHIDTAQSHDHLGLVLRRAGRAEEAEAEHRRALAIWTKWRAPNDPALGRARHNLGLALQAQGRYEEAEAEHRMSVAIKEKAYGPDHPGLALAYEVLGDALLGQGRYLQAEAAYRVALEIGERAFGLDHPSAQATLALLLEVLRLRGRAAEAETHTRAAMVRLAKIVGSEHPQVHALRHELGLSLALQQRHRDAEREFRAALAANEALHGPQDSTVAETLVALAESLLALRERSDAIDCIERALVIHRMHPDSAEELAKTQFALARALKTSSRHRTRALALAKEAHRVLRATPHAVAIERWIVAAERSVGR